MEINGFEATFCEIVKEYGKILSAFALKRVPAHDADDIVQETFVKAYLKIETLKNPSSLKAWLFAICRNCLSRHLRQERLDPDLPIESEMHPEIVNTSRETCSAAEIRLAMEHLEHSKQQYLILKYWSGFSYAEIAVLLQTTEKKVKSRIYESRQLLKKLLEQASFKKSPIPPKSLQEKIMKKIETIRAAAEIIARLSLASQLKLAESVRENSKFEADLLPALAEVSGGVEFVSACRGKLAVQEFADILHAADSGTMQRFFNALEKTNAEYADELKTELALSEVKAMPDESLQMETEKCSQNDDALIIRISGYLDNYNSDSFEKKLRALISVGYRYLVLDCSKFTYISSAGIGTLVVLLKDISVNRGSIFLCKLDSRIWEIFSFLGINTFFTKTGSINQALELCGSEQSSPITAGLAESDIIPLLPKEHDGEQGLVFAGFKYSNQQATGSFYDYKPLAGNTWALIVAEAAGTGPSIELARNTIAAAFHQYFEHTEAPFNVSEFMYALNSRMLSLGVKNRFAVITVLLADGNERSCTLCSAGHCGMAAYRHKDQKATLLATPTGPAAGTFPNWLVRSQNPYYATKFAFSNNDALYLFNDGLEDSRNKAGEVFSLERITGIVNREHHLALEAGMPAADVPRLCVDALVSAERQFRGETAPNEDMLILSIAFT